MSCLLIFIGISIAFALAPIASAPIVSAPAIEPVKSVSAPASGPTPLAPGI